MTARRRYKWKIHVFIRRFVKDLYPMPPLRLGMLDRRWWLVRCILERAVALFFCQLVVAKCLDVAKKNITLHGSADSPI